MDQPSSNLLLQIALCVHCAAVVGSLLAIAGHYHTVNHTIFKALPFLGAGAGPACAALVMAPAGRDELMQAVR